MGELRTTSSRLAQVSVGRLTQSHFSALALFTLSSLFARARRWACRLLQCNGNQNGYAASANKGGPCRGGSSDTAVVLLLAG